MIGDVPVAEQRQKGAGGDERDFSVGSGLAQRAEQRQRHHDVAQPVGQPDKNARPPRERG